MIPVPLWAAGFLLTYMIVKSNEDKPVQPSPPVVQEPVTDEVTKKRKRAEDLVYSTGFTGDGDKKQDTKNDPDKKKIDVDKKKIDVDKKKIDNAKMDQFVEISDKMFFYRVRADGRCLFRAIVAALYYMQGNEVEMLLSEQTKQADDLRKQIVTFMINNADKFENTHEEGECLEEYCEEMMEPKTHGTYSEVCAFHFMKGMQVEVYHLENDSLKIMHCINDHCKAGVDDVIRLFYNGKDHWDMLYVTE
jgi:hypothetical protein